MEKNLGQLLKTVKDSPKLGKLDSRVIENVRVRLMEQIANSSAPASAPTLFDALRAPFHGVEFRSILQPVTAMGVVFALGFSWVGSVFASMNSVPGDALYSLKIASEHAQLSFAGSDDSRARLHVEFANRRAEEVSQLLENKSDQSQVKVAMGNLKTELQSVSDHLSNAQDKEGALALAKLVDRKVGNLEATIDSNLEGATDSVKQEAAEVKDVVKVASVQALTMIAKEDGSKPSVTESLEKKVSAHLAEVKVTLKKGMKDANEVQEAFAKRAARLPIVSEADRKLAAELKQMKSDLADANDSLADADTAMSKKEYAGVMKISGAANEIATKAESRLAELKVETPKDEPIEVPVPETE